MPKNRIIVALGVVIALLPILGFPRLWESFFQVVTGLSIILLSVWATIDKRLMLKAKAHKRQIHKRKVAEINGQASTEVNVENATSDASVEVPILQEDRV